MLGDIGWGIGFYGTWKGWIVVVVMGEGGERWWVGLGGRRVVVVV